MKLILDFLPIILFFGAFKVADANAESAARFATEYLGFAVSGGVVAPGEAPVLLATVVVIAATSIQVSLLLLARRKVDTMLWITFALVTVLGGATIWFHNPDFIKWKPSVLYWAMGVIFWASQTLLGKNPLQALVGEQLHLPAPVWRRLTYAWIAFFAAMGAANLYVAYNYSSSTWATFKFFGLTGMMLLFMLGQGLYVARYVKDDEPESDVPRSAPVAGAIGQDTR
ncbi:MAG: septation protein A [Caldimonas sp.]